MPRFHLAARLVAGVSSLIAALPLAAAQGAPTTTSVAPPAYVPTSLAAEPSLPRTPDGHPDFQGVVWNAAFFGMMESTPLFPPSLTISDEKAKEAYDKMMAMFTSNPAIKKLIDADPEATAILEQSDGLPIVRGQRRTRLVVLPADGKIPMTPEGRKIASAAMDFSKEIPSNNPEDRFLGERCIALGGQAPLVTTMGARQIVQTRDHLLVHTEYGDEIRIIPFADRHGAAAPGQPMGDAIARWEGDTLVIETTNFPARDTVRAGFPTSLPLSPDAKVTERYARLSKNELLYQFTIEDPKYYSAPWLAEYSLFRAPFRMYPSSCHEGNYSLPNILSGQRVADARAASAKP